MPFFWRITFARILAAELRERRARKPETFRFEPDAHEEAAQAHNALAAVPSNLRASGTRVPAAANRLLDSFRQPAAALSIESIQRRLLRATRRCSPTP